MYLSFLPKQSHVQSPMHGVHIWLKVLVWTPETLRASQSERDTSVPCCLYLYLRPLCVKGASKVFLYSFQQFMTLHCGNGDMLRWITRFQLSRSRMQEAWDDTFVPITELNHPEVRAFVASLSQEDQATITAEDAIAQANERLKRQQALTFPVTVNLVALMFVSLADLTSHKINGKFSPLLWRIVTVL